MALPGSHNYIALIIDEVDLSTRTVWGYDKTVGKIQAFMRESPAGILRIPVQGERWTVERRGYYWYLQRKLDSNEEHTDTLDMSPGDIRISGATAESKVSITGDIVVNGQPLAELIADIVAEL